MPDLTFFQVIDLVMFVIVVSQVAIPLGRWLYKRLPAIKPIKLDVTSVMERKGFQWPPSFWQV